MKIIYSVVVLFLFGGSQWIHGAKFNCEFRDLDYTFVGLYNLYSCVVTSLVNPHNNITVDGYLGEHKANKNDADVKGIYIEDTDTKYIPTKLGSFSNLTALRMINTQLVEIKAKDFHGMQNLEYLSFHDNKLTSVPLNIFNILTKLKYIDLSSNQIEELPNGIFGNNLELEEIYLFQNKIKYLGTEMFNNLKKLDYVDLEWNICVNKIYNGATEIIRLKNYIKMKCKNPNEVPATTTTTTQTPTTTTTTQNPMNADFIEIKKSLSNFFDNLFTEILEANEKLKNQTMMQDVPMM